MILFECGVRYGKMADNGTSKMVNEAYLVDACSFAEAEARVTHEMLPYVSGDFKVTSIKRTNYSELVDGQASADKWFKAKILYVLLDERTGKEKKQPAYFIVHASDINKAHRSIVEHMCLAVDYEIATLEETKILDLFRYEASDNG